MAPTHGRVRSRRVDSSRPPAGSGARSSTTRHDEVRTLSNFSSLPLPANRSGIKSRANVPSGASSLPAEPRRERNVASNELLIKLTRSDEPRGPGSREDFSYSRVCRESTLRLSIFSENMARRAGFYSLSESVFLSFSL